MNFCFIRSPYRNNRNLICISLYFGITILLFKSNHISLILIFILIKISNMELSPYPLVSKFYRDYLSNRIYSRHNQLDGNISITLTSIFNYDSLLDEANKKLIQEKYNNNYRYFDDINMDKHSKFLKLRDSDIKAKSFKIESNEFQILSYDFPQFEIYFIAKLYINNMFIEPEVQTNIHFSPNMKETITFRYKYKDITTNSYIVLYIYSNQLHDDKSLLGTTTIHLFNDNFNLIQGRHLVKIDTVVDNENNKRDSFHAINDTELDNLVHNFYKERSTNKTKTYLKVPCKRDQVFSMPQEYLLNSYYCNEEKDTIILKDDDLISYESKLKYLLSQTSNTYIEVDFPLFNNPIVYEEQTAKSYHKSFNHIDLIKDQEVNNWVVDPAVHRGKNVKDIFLKDNPITEQFSILSRISEEDVRDLKPAPYEIEQINKKLNTPDFIKLDDQGATNFWRYRYALLKQDKKYALPKILNAVKWDQENVVNDFLADILTKWKTVEVCDILYMLSRQFNVNPFLYKDQQENEIPKSMLKGFKEVRKFAVSRLKEVPSDDINFILLQLVQALRYEDDKEPILRNMLIERCAESTELATSFYWFITVEAGNAEFDKKDEMEKMFYNTQQSFIRRIEGSEECNQNLQSQIKLRDTLLRISKEMSLVPKKIEIKKPKFKAIIEPTTELGKELYDEHFLPLNSKIKIKGINKDNCSVFRSAMFPVKYSFIVKDEYQKNNKEKEDPSKFETMFKFGDDLRQDQLILQIINYMNKLLLTAGQDYEFTTYKVLATSKSDGFVEFVPHSRTIFDLSKEYKTNCIKTYIDICSNNDKAEIDKRLNSFVNSCAGYCVVTYLLGIGDRHLENLLVDHNGKLFHIDFGYILGKDPKPSPPSMKLNPDMIKCMGDKGSKDFERFKNKCINAFWVLRENARLIVNMLYLMIDSGIPELNNLEALEKMHDKFLQEETKQDAANSLLTIIEESTNMYYNFLDTAHNIAAKFK